MLHIYIKQEAMKYTETTSHLVRLLQPESNFQRAIPKIPLLLSLCWLVFESCDHAGDSFPIDVNATADAILLLRKKN